MSNLAETTGSEDSRRKVLAAAVGAILHENGFHSAEKAALGTLVEMLQSVIYEIGRSSKQYMEIAYRTEPIMADIYLALSEMGITTESLQTYAKRSSRIVIPTPGYQNESKQTSILQAGEKKGHPIHIPDHLPNFPDTHTYCFSHTYKQPVTEYEAIREKSAQQKRDVERALSKFLTRTSDIVNLFWTEDKEFLVAAPKPNPRPYVDALMPRDQVFEEDEEYEAKLRKKRKDDNEDDGGNDDAKEKEVQEDINPFLQSVKMPKKTSSKAANVT